MIRKRNLDNGLIQWIMTQTGLGPGIGKIKYVAPAAAATAQYRTILEEQGVDSGDIYTSLASAYAAIVTRRNDIIIAAPALYTLTAEVAWAIDNAHLLGIGTGLPHADWTLTPNIPIFYTATTDQANIVNLTGEANSFRNVIFENYGNNAACLNAVTVNGYLNSFIGCGIHGIMTTNQVSTAAACSLNIAAGGHYPLFRECEIGTREWGTRTSTTQGHLRFTGASGGGPGHGRFDNCIFSSRAETAGVPMVYMVGLRAATSLWRFTDCLFYNFWNNWEGMCDSVFQNPTSGQNTCSIVLENCTAVGFTEWQQREFKGVTYTNEGWIMTNMPITGTAGGLTKLPTGTVGN